MKALRFALAALALTAASASAQGAMKQDTASKKAPAMTKKSGKGMKKSAKDSAMMKAAKDSAAMKAAGKMKDPAKKP